MDEASLQAVASLRAVFMFPAVQEHRIVRASALAGRWLQNDPSDGNKNHYTTCDLCASAKNYGIALR
jgi:hypothetical protein